MAQFPLSDLLTGAKRLFTGLQGKKPDGTYTDVKVTSNGEVFTASAGSASLKATVLNVPAAGTRVRLPDYPCREITIIGRGQNTGKIFVGGSDVTKSNYGAELVAKDSITLSVNNTNLIYIDSTISGEGISYLAL